MTTAAARTFVRELDLSGVFACPMCLFDVAWRIHKGEKIWPQTLASTASTTWYEIEPGLYEAVVEARMREVAGAEDALDDIHTRGPHGAVARAVVERLAHAMADEIASRSP